MSKIVQVAGGNASQQNAYTGPARELTVDTSNWDLRIHDGVTPGGRVVMNRDNADQRYQFKSLELSGLTGFSPEQRGLLARLGPADYRLRSVAVNAQQLTITNADGYAGNPTIGLAPTIQTAHTWSLSQLFQQVVTAVGGFVGNLIGNVTGDLLGNVIGNVTGNLLGNAQGNHTGSFTGNVNVAAHSITFADGQIPTSAINNLINFIKLHAVPFGTIVAWSGSIASIPAGWALCNGTNSTPDLRDRFIVGAGSATYPVGASGGTWTHIHNANITGGAHNHGISIDQTVLTLAQMPAHNHGNGISDDNIDAILFRGTQNTTGLNGGIQSNTGAGRGAFEGLTESKGSSQGHTHGVTLSGDGSHAHSAAISEQSHIPPYYALAFIMRV